MQAVPAAQEVQGGTGVARTDAVAMQPLVPGYFTPEYTTTPQQQQQEMLSIGSKQPMPKLPVGSNAGIAHAFSPLSPLTQDSSGRLARETGGKISPIEPQPLTQQPIAQHLFPSPASFGVPTDLVLPSMSGATWGCNEQLAYQIIRLHAQKELVNLLRTRAQIAESANQESLTIPTVPRVEHTNTHADSLTQLANGTEEEARRMRLLTETGSGQFEWKRCYE
jgi:hypothetical protein